MSYSTEELRAINHYCETHNSIPQLSARPIIRLMHRNSKKITEQNIFNLVARYREVKKADAKELAKYRKSKAKS